MNYSIEAQSEGLYLFSMNANIKPSDYPVDEDLWQFYTACKVLTEVSELNFKNLVEQYNLFKRQPDKEFHDSVILSYCRNILLFKLTTLYQNLFNDYDLLENLK